MPRIEKPISDFLTGKPALSVQADATVKDAIEAMTSEQLEYVLVVEDGAILGIFTERDFLNRVVGAQRLPQETPVREVMTPEPDHLRPIDNFPYVIERMASRGYRHVPIVDDKGSASVLTVWDVMSHLTDVLAEVENDDFEEELEEWADIGGG